MPNKPSVHQAQSQAESHRKPPGGLAGTILAAFDLACDAEEPVIAGMLLRTLEGLLSARTDPSAVQTVLHAARGRLRGLENTLLQ